MARKTTAKKKTSARKTKKTAAKKAASKKKTASKKTAAKSRSGGMGKTSAVRDPMTQSQLVGEISDDTGLARKEVRAVLDSLGLQMERHLRKGGAGKFNLMGMIRLQRRKKPARKGRWGVNPFTGEEQWFEAKPASTTVKATPLKKLKEMVT